MRRRTHPTVVHCRVPAQIQLLIHVALAIIQCHLVRHVDFEMFDEMLEGQEVKYAELQRGVSEP